MFRIVFYTIGKLINGIMILPLDVTDCQHWLLFNIDPVINSKFYHLLTVRFVLQGGLSCGK